MEMTRTKETEARYLRLAKMLLKMYRDDTDENWKNDPMLFCHWFTKQKTKRKWERSTWRQYKAACIFFMRVRGPKECVEFLFSEGNEGCSKKQGENKRGAMLKQKRLPKEDLIKILSRLSPHQKWDRLLALWLTSAVLTGLRPSEWKDATLSGTILRVKNGKNTNGRANGDYRHLDLSSVPAENFRALKAFIILLSKQDYETTYQACRGRLRMVSKQIWPRRKSLPSLYSARHQFRADASANDYSLSEVAALLGHGSNETAMSHYGRKAVGNVDAQLPIPDKAEVLTVRDLGRTFPHSAKDAINL